MELLDKVKSLEQTATTVLHTSAQPLTSAAGATAQADCIVGRGSHSQGLEVLQVLSRVSHSAPT